MIFCLFVTINQQTADSEKKTIVWNDRIIKTNLKMGIEIELLNVSIRGIRLYSHILLNKKIDVYLFIK